MGEFPMGRVTNGEKVAKLKVPMQWMQWINYNPMKTKPMGERVNE